MARKYNNPPVIEALCEFRFEQDAEWDPTVYGLMYEEIREEFPTRRKARQLTLGLTTGDESVTQNVRASDRMQYLSHDSKTLVQIAENLLVVNRLAPYESWEQLLPRIASCYEKYVSIVSPKRVARIGLRYINRFDLPGPSVELEDYFEFRPYLGPDLPDDHGPFSLSVFLPYDNERDVLKVELGLGGAATADPQIEALVLNLDYFLNVGAQVGAIDVPEWLESAHGRVECTFEACMTQKLRATLD